MIPRYSREEMANIWEEENKFKLWMQIEAYACEAQEELGVIPKGVAKAVWEKGGFEISRILEIEKEVKHDVIAFLTNLAENVGDEARFIHQGMTSSDIIDTCFSLRLKQSAEILIKDVDKILEALKKRALEHKNSICIGRSHGIHAEPTTFGVKLAGFYAEFERAKKRLEWVKDEISTCAISGAVGTFANINPYVEEYVAKKMDLSPEPVSTQVIPRDRHAMFFAVLGVIASSVERLAIEIRHLQRTEVREASEFFSKGQKGSSAMPHKKNPILTENLTGLARVVRSYVTPSLENVALWHERDISHSSAERFSAPDATITLDFALNRLAGVVEKLLIYPENMKANLNKLKGLVNSQRVLLALTQNGISREKAYSIVQTNALKVWEEDVDFLELLKADKDVCEKIEEKELEELFDYEYHIQNAGTIMKRVFGE
jgi:adenylosuccinate lyase